MRLLLVAALPYPLAQGSQVYLQEQAIALRAAGAEVDLLTYGSGDPTAANAARALTGFRHLRAPTWTAPRSLRSGPGIGKPLADLGLAMTLRDAIASNTEAGSYDAILTHNAEACVIALCSLRKPRPAIVYCVHTLLGHELSTYIKCPKNKRISVSSEHRTRLERVLDAAGSRVDRWMARRVDGWIALTQTAQRVMRQASVAPGALIAPPIPDPLADPTRLDPEATARSFDLEPGHFFLYSGNLDPYQELGVLGEAARRLARTGTPAQLVIATHDPRAERLAGEMPGVEIRRVGSTAEMQALLESARATLLMRRAVGGFPIKLANALALGTPAIAFREREWGLEDGVNASIAPLDAPAAGLAAAIERLRRDDGLADKLRAGARALYLARHRPEDAARQTLELVEEVLRRREPDPGAGDRAMLPAA